MRTVRILKISFIGLTTHALRSFLAALGVVLGVAAVVAMMAISEGARRESLQQIRALGIDNIVVVSVKPPLGSDVASGRQESRVEDYGIKNVEREHIRATFENVRTLVSVRDMRRDIYAQGKRADIRLMATTPEFLTITKSKLVDSRSRFLSEQDGIKRKAVCVVGTTAARKLFGFRDPIGETISIVGMSFQVVGLFENPLCAKLAGAHDFNNLIYVPLETANAMYGASLVFPAEHKMTTVEIDYLYIRVRDVKQIRNTAARLKTYLAQNHDTLDYRVQIPYELMKQMEATQRIFTIVMASIAAISLLVGGIGIMNIMLANIYERTREIGTRRALGAKKKDILIQFLAESILLTAIGGMLGLLLGVAISACVEHFADMDTFVTTVSIVVSLFVSILTGVTFGTYPAWKAANLDPIVALRHE